MTVSERETPTDINPKGTLRGSSKQQQWQILQWHEIRLTKITKFLEKIDEQMNSVDENLKTMATELVSIKSDMENLKKMQMTSVQTDSTDSTA